MAHYDCIYEDVSKSDIETKLERAEASIQSYKEKEKLIEQDLTNVIHEISRKMLQNESNKMVWWRESHEKEVVRLNKLLEKHNNGFKVSRYELWVN